MVGGLWGLARESVSLGCALRLVGLTFTYWSCLWLPHETWSKCKTNLARKNPKQAVASNRGWEFKQTNLKEENFNKNIFLDLNLVVLKNRKR